MSFINRTTKTYNSSIAILTALTLFFGLGTVILGHLLVPFAASFFAMLLLAESYGKRRILSYVAPLVVLAVDVIVNRIYLFECIAFILIGLILFIMYAKRVRKSETVFTLSAILFVLYAVSLVFAIFRITKSFSFESAVEFVSSMYEQTKTSFVEFMTYIQSVGMSNSEELLLSQDMLVSIYNGTLVTLPAVFAVLSIASVGIASKLFKFFVIRFTPDAPFAMRWRLHTSTPVAIVYIVSAILNMFTGTGIFGICVSWTYIVLSIVYAYIGVNFLFQFISIKKNAWLAGVIIGIAFFFFTSFAYQLASFFGAYYVISVNKRARLNRYD